MARDHARIRLDIWADDEFRGLSAIGQWLYLCLLTSPQLSFCGVTDWRPARIAAVTSDLTALDVESFAAELEGLELIVVDRDSEEVLVRSFVKHDGLLKQPNMAKALVKDHAGIASAPLRAVVVRQLERLRESEPSLRGWLVPEMRPLLRRASMTAGEAISSLPRNPSVKPSDNPSENPPDHPSSHTSVTHLLPTSLLPTSLPGSPRVPAQPQEELA